MRLTYLILFFGLLIPVSGRSASLEMTLLQDTQDKSDPAVAFRSEMALLANGQVSGYRIDIAVQNGVVTARGIVDTELQKRTVLNVLRAVSGVKEVKLDVQVNPAKIGQPTVIRVPGSNPRKDQDLADKVKAALQADPEFRADRVDVQVSRGSVQLKGEVKNRTAILRAAHVARDVPGVISVNASSMTTKETRVPVRGETRRVSPRLSGQEIRDVQLALQAAGLYKGPTDGIWNDLTERALITFQTRYNLPITGRLDAATVSALHLNIPIQAQLPAARPLEGRNQETNAASQQVKKTPPESSVVVITVGDVKTVQQALQTQGIYRGPITGRLDQSTRAAVRAFQRSRQLPPSGDIDQGTVNALGLRIDLSRKNILQ